MEVPALVHVPLGINRNKVDHLTNCVVFPCRWSRSHNLEWQIQEIIWGCVTNSGFDENYLAIYCSSENRPDAHPQLENVVEVSVQKE